MASLDLDNYLNKIEVLTNNGSHEQAICHCLYLLRQFPRNLALYKKIGRLFLETGKTSSALDAYLRVCNTEPEDALNHIALTYLFSEIGDAENVYFHCRTALCLQPENQTLYRELEKWLNIIPKDQQDTFTWLDRFAEGIKAYSVKEYAHAAEFFLESLEISGSVLPEVFLTLSLFCLGMETEAQPYLNHILETSPYNLSALRMSAYLTSDRDPILFNQYLQRLIDIDPGYEHWEIKKGQISPTPFPIRVAYFEWTGIPNAQFRIGRQHQVGEKIVQSSNDRLPQWLKLLPMEKSDTILISSIRSTEQSMSADRVQKTFFKEKAKNEPVSIPLVPEETPATKAEKPNELDQAFSFLEQIAENGIPSKKEVSAVTHSEPAENHPEADTEAAPPIFKKHDDDDAPFISPKRTIISTKTNHRSGENDLQMVRSAWRSFSTGKQAEGVKLYQDLAKRKVLPSMLRSDLEKLVILFPEIPELAELLGTLSEESHD